MRDNYIFTQRAACYVESFFNTLKLLHCDTHANVRDPHEPRLDIMRQFLTEYIKAIYIYAFC